MKVRNIEYDRVDEVVATLHEAFYDYPVMRFTLGRDVADFDTMHERLIRLFVMGRVFCKESLLGIGESNQLDAAAAVNLPETTGIPDALREYRQEVWATFKPEAKSRYDAFVSACAQFDVDLPHHHLGMIGVRNAHKGSGLGRILVEHVIEMAEQHPKSHGVSLSTENPSNVPFYKYMGFDLTGHAQVAPGFETWNFFRQK